MATYTTYTDGSSIAQADGAGVYAGAPGPFVIEGTYDATKRNAASADLITVAQIPAGAIVTNITYEVLTVDSGGGTLNCGATSGAGFVAATALSAATKLVGVGATLVAGGAYYASKTPVNLTGATATVTTAKVKIQVFGYLTT